MQDHYRITNSKAQHYNMELSLKLYLIFLGIYLIASTHHTRHVRQIHCFVKIYILLCQYLHKGFVIDLSKPYTESHILLLTFIFVVLPSVKD